ncbi:MAG: DUF4272 domain-containing protein [Bacteroidales bacterium]|nr:DUF4272 domain-containing protein [Lachnoclostridium sp.]MCM1385446.1 DUF4272 domain-containing protein [Lachnoclostridium sp.]MCM1466351.1 DUF4272 domain-containing protein [Bacteroidales bacterium]
MLFQKKKEPITGNIFMLGMENDMEKIIQIFEKAFGLPHSQGGNTLTLNNGDITVQVMVVTQSMGEEAKAHIEDQSGRVLGHFYEVKTQKTDVKLNLMYQLSFTNSLVTVSYSYGPKSKEYPMSEKQKLEYIKAPFFDSLAEWGAVMLLMEKPNGIFYKDAGGIKLILDEQGRSDVDIFMPYVLQEPDFEGAPIEALERRKGSRKLLTEKGIFVPQWYPMIETKEFAVFKTPEEIAKRAVALLTVALYSEAMLGDNLSPKEAYEQYAAGIIETFDAESFFSPKEWEYLHNEDSSRQERISYSWQYENLYVMEWALGLGKEEGELNFPNAICDVPYTVRVLKNCMSIQDILDMAKPKTPDELLAECDLIFCLDWACVDARIKNLPAPAGMDGGVTMERHKSLNWLVGAYDNADWDNVSTDT